MSGRVEWVLAALERVKVRYLVVGGVAVVLHGYLRTTLDLDLVLHLEGENLDRALEAFAGLGFRPQAPIQENMTVFSLWHQAHPGFAVDLFAQEPFDFDAVYRRAP